MDKEYIDALLDEYCSYIPCGYMTVNHATTIDEYLFIEEYNKKIEIEMAKLHS